MQDQPTVNDFIVAITRFEAKQDAMMEKLDRLEKTTDTHWKKIAEMETQIELLKERQGPRIHWITWVIGLIAAAGFGFAILDRLYIGA